MSSDLSSWLPLGKHFIRQVRVYESMRWDVDLASSIVACAPCGGPVAVTRDTTKLVELRGGGDDDITIYSIAGSYVRCGGGTLRGSLGALCGALCGVLCSTLRGALRVAPRPAPLLSKCPELCAPSPHPHRHPTPTLPLAGARASRRRCGTARAHGVV